jgi:hypothetical protein
MRLNEEESRQQLQTRGAFATGACDQCGQILGPARYTRQGEKGEWCSWLCRDDYERKAGTCRSCGVSLIDMRKHAQFCSEPCWKRLRARDRKKNAETSKEHQGLTGSISSFGCRGSLKTEVQHKNARNLNTNSGGV